MYLITIICNYISKLFTLKSKNIVNIPIQSPFINKINISNSSIKTIIIGGDKSIKFGTLELETIPRLDKETIDIIQNQIESLEERMEHFLDEDLKLYYNDIYNDLVYNYIDIDFKDFEWKKILKLHSIMNVITTVLFTPLKFRLPRIRDSPIL